MLIPNHIFNILILLSLYDSTQAIPRAPRRKLSDSGTAGAASEQMPKSRNDTMVPSGPDYVNVSTADPNIIGNKPMMGWNSYNFWGCNMDSGKAFSNLNDFADSGLIAFGYIHYNVDCGWIAKDRDPVSNAITADRNRWMMTMDQFGKEVKSKKMRFGLTTSLGVYACGSSTDDLRPGSYFHEEVDAKALADFGADFVKINACFYHADKWDPTLPFDDFDARYNYISHAMINSEINQVIINQLGVPLLPNIDSSNEGEAAIGEATPGKGKTTADQVAGSIDNIPFGIDHKVKSPEEWAAPYGTQYRIADSTTAGNGAPTGWNEILRIINQAIHVSAKDGASGPGQYADLDLLAVGNDGLTYDEQCTHYAFWALFKSPLMVSMDPAKLFIEKYTWILTRKELIAANQDVGGKPIKLIERFTDDYDVFAGDLSNNEMTVLVVDYSNNRRYIDIDLSSIGVVKADIIDMWTEARYDGIQGIFKGWIEAHGSMALKLVNIERIDQSPSYTWCEAETGVLSYGANIQPCARCSGGQKVGNLIGGASLTFNDIPASSATQYVNIHYLNSEIHYAGSAIPNIRGANFFVNGVKHAIKMPISDYDWQTPATFFRVQLSGFRPHETNTIVVQPAPEISPYAPDIDQIGIDSTIVNN